MLRLLLLRHAKATRKDGRYDDFDRPLTVEGWEEARRIGAFIAAEYPADVAIASAARRTRETVAALLSYTSRAPICRFSRQLYEGGVEALLGFAAETSANLGTVALVGHNPAIEEAIRYLSWPGDPPAEAAAASGVPTGGLVVFEFDIADWRDARPGQGQLVATKWPRQLPASEPAPKD